MLKSKYFVCAVALLLITNTNYFWEGTLGPFAILELIAIAILLVISLIGFFKYLISSIKQKFKNKHALKILASIFLLLLIFFFKPNGIVNWQSFESEDVLVAERGGAAGCLTTLKLKRNGKFKLRNVCFGLDEQRGSYLIKGDTICFINPLSDRYEFGVLKADRFNHGKKVIYLHTLKDSVNLSLFVKQNNLSLN